MDIRNIRVSKLQNAANPLQQDLEETIESLQAVVLTQKAQIDALLASLEGLLAALNSPASPLGQGWAQPLLAQAVEKSAGRRPEPMPPQLARENTVPENLDAGLLGNPLDPQFENLHRLMQRLTLG